MIHDQTASTVLLAKSVLFGIDRQSLYSNVQTACLVLMLETLIDLGTPVSNQKIIDSASKAVMGTVSHIEGEVKAVHEEWAKEADAQAALVEQKRR